MGAARGDRPGHRADAAGHDGHAALATATVGGRQAPGHPRPPVGWARGARGGPRRAAGLDFGDLGDEADARVRAAILDEALDVVAGLVGDGRAELDGDPPHGAPRRCGRCPCSGPGCRSGSPASPRTGARWSGPAAGTGTCRSARPGPDELAAYVGEHPRPGWDLVVPWADGVPPDEYADAGRHLAGAVRMAEGRRVGAGAPGPRGDGPPKIDRPTIGAWTSSGTPRARRGCSTPSWPTRRPWWRSSGPRVAAPAGHRA